MCAKAPILQFVFAFNLHEFRFEDQRGVRWDFVAGARFTVAQLWRNDQATLLADAHAQQTLIPAFDNLTIAYVARCY